jgi:uncharacterized protein (DUF2147 family)
MKRFFYLAVLMALSSSASAGESFSFVVDGHRIHIEAPRNCNSPSCVTVSIPGIYETRRRRDRYDDDAAPAKPTAPAAQPVVVRPIAPPATRPAVEPAVAPPSPPPVAAPPVPIQQQAALSSPPLQPPAAPPAAASPPATSPVAAPAVASPVANTSPQLLQVSHDVDDEPELPLGDWRTEANKGSVRIERCGRALCGYLLNPSNAKAESVLINMKPKAASQWSGNVYSRDSGETYYGTMVLEGPNALRVEACALGRFFCSGNVWTRIGGKPGKLITARQTAPEPRT